MFEGIEIYAIARVKEAPTLLSVQAPDMVEGSGVTYDLKPSEKVWDDIYLMGLSREEWKAIERDVKRGSKLFWARRGLPEPDGGWHGWTRLVYAITTATESEDLPAKCRGERK